MKVGKASVWLYVAGIVYLLIWGLDSKSKYVLEHVAIAGVLLAAGLIYDWQDYRQRKKAPPLPMTPMEPPPNGELPVTPPTDPVKPFPNQKIMVALFVLYILVGESMSLPCLCQEGAVKGSIKSLAMLMVVVRLGYSLLQRRLRYGEFFIYTGIHIAFCVGVEMMGGH